MYYTILLDADDLQRIDKCMNEFSQIMQNKLTESQQEQYKETCRRLQEQFEDQQK